MAALVVVVPSVLVMTLTSDDTASTIDEREGNESDHRSDGKSDSRLELELMKTSGSESA
jgi:hypothetical protein